MSPIRHRTAPGPIPPRGYTGRSRIMTRYAAGSPGRKMAVVDKMASRRPSQATPEPFPRDFCVKYVNGRASVVALSPGRLRSSFGVSDVSTRRRIRSRVLRVHRSVKNVLMTGIVATESGGGGETAHRGPLCRFRHIKSFPRTVFFPRTLVATFFRL